MATISFGTPLTVNTTSSGFNSGGVALSGATAIAAYWAASSPTSITFKKYTLAGITPPAGTSLVESISNLQPTSVVMKRVSATRFIVGWQTEDTTNCNMYVAVYDTSSGLVRVGTPKLVASMAAIDTSKGPFVAVLTDSRFVVAWLDATYSPDASHKIKAVPVDLTGSIYTQGTTGNVLTADSQLTDICDVDSTTAAITYYQPFEAIPPRIVALYNISASTFSVGATPSIIGFVSAVYGQGQRKENGIIACPLTAYSSPTSLHVQGFGVSTAGVITIGTRNTIASGVSGGQGLLAWSGAGGGVGLYYQGYSDAVPHKFESLASSVGSTTVGGNADDTTEPANTVIFSALSYLAGDYYWGVYSYDDGGDGQIRAMVITVSSAPVVAEAMTVFLSVSSACSSFFWQVLWRGGTLYLQRRYLTSGLLANEISLGAATSAEVAAKTWFAGVSAVNDTTAYVWGRMNAPGALGGTQHIIKTIDGAASFTSITAAWGANYCACLAADPAGNFVAYRSGGSYPLYYGDTLRELPNSAGVIGEPAMGGIIIAGDGAIIAASGAATVKMVQALPPYTVWTNILGAHPSGAGVAHLVKI